MLCRTAIVHPLKCVCKFSVIARYHSVSHAVTKFANLMNGDTVSCRSMYRLPTGGIRYLKHSRERHRPSEINVKMKSVKIREIRGNKNKKTMKKNIQLILSVALCIFGCIMLACGFIAPPMAEIHHSVLIAFGEILTFSGSLIGIDYRYRKDN